MLHKRRRTLVLAAALLSLGALAAVSLAQPKNMPKPQSSPTIVAVSDSPVVVVGEEDPDDLDTIAMLLQSQLPKDATIVKPIPADSGGTDCNMTIYSDMSCFSGDGTVSMTSSGDPSVYGRGFGHTSEKNCEKKEGRDCVKCIAFWYPTCKDGYQPAGCNLCEKVTEKNEQTAQQQMSATAAQAAFDDTFKRDSYGRGFGYVADTYGRGAGYPWKFGDKLNLDGAKKRCENDNGKGNCEKYGEIYYPKCKSGYSNSGCCICTGSAVANCEAKEGTSCEMCGLLAYPKCKSGYQPFGCNICEETL